MLEPMVLRAFFTLLVLLSSLGRPLCAQVPLNTMSNPFHLKNNPSWLKLLKTVGMEAEDPSLKEMNAWAQAHLLRRGERWEAQSPQFEGLQEGLLPLFEDLGLMQDAHAQCNHYQGALIHGAHLIRMRLRLDYLVQEWNRGVRFQDLYFLSGERDLEPEEAEKSGVTTENELTEWLWQNTDIPLALRHNLSVHFISAPKKKEKKSGKYVRPTTDDTLYAWLKTNPLPGRYLAISNAPYIMRQDLVTQSIVPSQYVIDTVGPQVNPQEKMAILLDECARTLFQLKKLEDENTL